MKNKITKEQFVTEYVKRSGVTPQQLHEMGFEAIPCDCNEKKCYGWQMVEKHDFSSKGGRLMALCINGEPHKDVGIIVRSGMKLKPNTWYRLKDFVRFVLKKGNIALVYHRGFKEGNFGEWNAD